MKNCKNLFLGTALVTLVSLLPAHSFAAPASISTSIEGEEGAFFIAPKWTMGFGGGGKISSVKSGDTEYEVWGNSNGYSEKIDPAGEGYKSVFLKGDYSPDYDMSWKSGGLQLGYFLSGTNYSGMRIQLDADYSYSYVKGYQSSDKELNNTYYAVAKKGSELSTSDTVSLIQHKGQVVMNGSLDLCYDMVPEGVPVSPFACLGAGVSRISLEGVKTEGKDAIFYKPAAQVKVGASYHFTPQFQAFVAGHLQSGLGDSEFNKVKIAVDSASVSKEFTYSQYMRSYGAEVGLRLVF